MLNAKKLFIQKFAKSNASSCLFFFGKNMLQKMWKLVIIVAMSDIL